MECGKAASGVRKVKKKQVKDELDRIKQAEKKKRRLEKALAASAAIISELEKKNQKKKEEQQRLDEECAAIAEAVALQVLMGEESDKTCNEEWYPWGCCTTNFDIFHAKTTAARPHQLPNGEVSDGSRCRYGFSSDVPAVEDSEAALMAAQAISSLQIADDAFVFNRMLRG